MPRAASKRRTPKPQGIRRVLGWIVRAILIFLLGSVLWVLLYRFANPPITITQASDVLSGRHLSRDWMAIEEIDHDMKRAVIAAEDSKFCAHWGFDQDAIAEAMRRNAKGGSVIRGGSTISQQTAKNAFLWQGGGYFRKGLEAWFTLLIENLWSKQRIMEVYLNLAETGIGTYGVNAGAQRYFDKDASGLTRTEAARIAAVLPLPKRREAVAPSGFTRRYGNSIVARIGVVQRDRLDSCVYGNGDTPSAPDHLEEPVRRTKARAKVGTPLPERPPALEPGLDYEEEPAAAAPVPIPAEDASPAPEAEPSPEDNAF
jgi:monofunctional biosynthetic peptidoglycan transglycosylase